ncbi:MAG: shikimate dehydrogenase, partial [Anaerolineae bacterium]
VTHRPEREGGAYRGSEDERLAVLRHAIALGAAYVDVEADSVQALGERGGSKLIVSHHDLTGTAHPLHRLYADLAGLGADVVKVAVTANDIADNLDVFEVLRRAERPTIALAMGEAGVVSRLLAGRFGAFLTFASLDGDAAVAPGQVPLRDMLRMYRVREVTQATRLFGVIANPVGHSMSPAVHNAAFAALGLDALYLPLLVRDLEGFVASFTPLGFEGYSVTIPHKQAIIPLLDEVEPLAQRIGAVNTVAVRNGRLYGSNTDVEGAMLSIAEALPAGQPLAGLTALLIGAGGLARALAFGLRDRGVRVVIANRTADRARDLAAEAGAETLPLADIASVRADLLLQTTSVGMHPKVDESIVPAEALRPGLLVYDAVYNPLETRLLREARQAGCITVSGLGHFINQAAKQFELWTGVPAPREVMRAEMLRRLGY